MMESFLSFSRVINGFTEFKQKLDLKARPQVNIGRSLFTNARRTNYDNEKHKNLPWTGDIEKLRTKPLVESQDNHCVWLNTTGELYLCEISKPIFKCLIL